jgi:hypothetical protein
MQGTGEIKSRERRFLGWFCFYFVLPDGQHPAELAAKSLFKDRELSTVLKSIQGARYVNAVVTMVNSGRVYLEIEDERLELESRLLSARLYGGEFITAYILPIGRGRWLLSPGWVIWPIRMGPGIRSELKSYQMKPIDVERFFQGRGEKDTKPVVEHPQDTRLETAVARMTEAARTAGKNDLILSADKWAKMVVNAMNSSDSMIFSKEIIRRFGQVESEDEMNMWFALAMNIWNNTPQPDRGGKTANELIKNRQNSDIHYAG